MLNNAAGLSKIVLVTGYTDLRRGIDGLAALIKTEYGRDPFEKDVLYLFAGRQAGKIKCLLWEGDGFLLLYKRLENGRFNWPRNENDVRELTLEQYTWLLQGLSIDQPKAIKKITGRLDIC